MLSDVSSLPLSVLMMPLKLKKGGQAQAWSADLRDEPRGAYWMLNGSAWPNGASACSLSSVLETGPIPEKYYLSARACSGILRRAEKRGKQLPKALREALEAVANGRQTLAPPLNTSWADRSAGSQAQEWDSEKGGRFVPDVGFALNAKGGGGRIDGESKTFVAYAIDRDRIAPTMEGRAGSSGANNFATSGGLIEVAHSLRADGFDASKDGTGCGTPLVPMGFRACGQDGFTPADVAPPITSTDGGGAGVPSVLTFHGTQDPCANYGDTSPTIGCNQGQEACIAFHENQRGEVTVNDTAGALKVGGGKPGQGYPAIAYNLRGRDGGAMPEPTDVASIRAASGGSSRTYVGVRRLTPIECERLQGFPDGWTAIPFRGKPAADGPRYKALGNSMAVPVMRWIGQRIANQPW